jgi:hypothetical protein
MPSPLYARKDLTMPKYLIPPNARLEVAADHLLAALYFRSISGALEIVVESRSRAMEMKRLMMGGDKWPDYGNRVVVNIDASLQPVTDDTRAVLVNGYYEINEIGFPEHFVWCAGYSNRPIPIGIAGGVSVQDQFVDLQLPKDLIWKVPFRAALFACVPVH